MTTTYEVKRCTIIIYADHAYNIIFIFQLSPFLQQKTFPYIYVETTFFERCAHKKSMQNSKLLFFRKFRDMPGVYLKYMNIYLLQKRGCKIDGTKYGTSFSRISLTISIGYFLNRRII